MLRQQQKEDVHFIAEMCSDPKDRHLVWSFFSFFSHGSQCGPPTASETCRFAPAFYFFRGLFVFSVAAVQELGTRGLLQRAKLPKTCQVSMHDSPYLQFSCG